MASPRSRWPIRRFRLGEEPPDDISEVTSPRERLSVMCELAREGWELAGRELPKYAREDIPMKLYRPHERPPEE